MIMLTAPLLKVNNVSIVCQAPLKKNLVRNVSFTVERGERIAICGESGAGKTTIAQAIPGLLEFKHGFEMSGDIIFDGLPVNHKNLKGESIRGKRIGFIFQEPLLALNPLIRVGDQLAETIRILNKDLNAKKSALDWFEKLELLPSRQYYQYYPHQLSGGMRQRVMIALSLAGFPDLVIADEPTSGIDAVLKHDLMKLLVNRCDSSQISLLFITHDINMAARYAHRILVMKDGEIVEDGSAADVLSKPQHSYTKLLLDKHHNINNN